MKKIFATIIAFCLCMTCFAGFSFAESAGKTIVLFTNDVHCRVDDNIGYAGIAAYRDQLEAEGNSVILVDVGDAIQGAPIGTLSDGGFIVDIMNETGYALAIPGNHEYDYGMDRFFEITEMAEFPYLSVNFVDLRTGESVLPGTAIIEVNGVKIGFVGVTTPETVTSSSPTNFMDENGEFIYGFMQHDQTGAEFYGAIQAGVDSVRAEGAEYVVLMAHLGIDYVSGPWTSTAVIENTRGIDVVLDGHSHSIIEQEKVKNLDGEEVLLCSTGTQITAIGYFEIAADGTLSTGLVTDYTEKNPEVDAYIQNIQGELAEVLDVVVASTNVDLICEDVDTGVRLVRLGETNLGNLCADAYRAVTGADIAFVNGGGVRANLPAGDITYGDIISVHPFGNELCVVETTGQDILDSLEVGAMALPDAEGGFLQVSGLTYEIDISVPSPVVLDENGMMIAIEGERRVRNVMVNGEPIDPNGTYTLASHNFLIKNGGDGHSMFMDDELLLDSVMLDNQVLITYIVDILGGVIGEEYAEPFGEGRITIIQPE